MYRTVVCIKNPYAKGAQNKSYQYRYYYYRILCPDWVAQKMLVLRVFYLRTLGKIRPLKVSHFCVYAFLKTLLCLVAHIIHRFDRNVNEHTTAS